MINESHRKTLQSNGILLGRTLIGLLFVYAGYGMLMDGAEVTAGFYASVGVPMAALAYWVVLAVKLGGGLALVLGYKVEQAALALILFTLGATYFGHRDWSVAMNDMATLKNLAIVGGLLYVMAFGAGTGWKIK
jgi:putative oxidoreductase